MSAPTLRVARPTNDLDALLRFYRDGLGMEILGRFEDHAGFDGLILGKKDAPYHLEFTRKRGHAAGRSPTPDNLLVFYLPDCAEWDGVVRRMRCAGHVPVPSFNPYWDKHGVTFEDPDGYRIVFQRTSWRDAESED